MDLRSIQRLPQVPSASLKAVQLVATDMDGTLTRQGKFSPALMQALLDLQTAGILVLIVTGRSAGWVQSVVNYLPVVGAIAENGGLYITADQPLQLISDLGDLGQHRLRLADLFQHIQTRFPILTESLDNAFRLTDWTFDVGGLSQGDLATLAILCREQGWGFTYSTVQCHLKPPEQDKATALNRVLEQHFSHLSSAHVMTVGDSPNDESLFNAALFPVSVGVANLNHYIDRLTHRPAFITAQPEVDGFCEMARSLLAIRQDAV